MPKTPPDHAESIKQLLANPEELLNEHFQKAYTFRDDDDIIRLSFTHEVGKNEFGELIASSSISFGKRVKAEVEHVVETNMTFSFEPKKEAPADGN